MADSNVIHLAFTQHARLGHVLSLAFSEVGNAASTQTARTLQVACHLTPDSKRGNTVKLNRFGSTVAIAMAASLVLTACGGDEEGDDTTSAEETTEEEAAEEEVTEEEADDSEAPAEDGGETDAPAAGGEYTPAEGLSGNLVGAGASSQSAAVTAWIAGYNGVQPDVAVQYDPVGSGSGRDQLIAGATDFAGSDAALDEEEAEAVKEVCGPDGAMHLPLYISPVAIPYNLPGVDALNLSPTVLAQIFNQEITTWNDEAIAADNPDADLPDTDITVVNRSDESGTTENFMEYLTAAAPDAWPHEVSGDWPVSGGEAAAQTQGVMQVVNATEGAIGYADASAVTGQSASIGVGDEFVPFSPEAAAKVVDASDPVEGSAEGDLALELARDTTESGAYPIVLVSYHVVCKSYDDANRADLVKDYVGYVASVDGQQASADAAGSAPISEDMRSQVNASLELIQGG
ncbi:phosphate ABC transporter substrate-binding protein PstS [Ornithinimicrobium murale]|uniref:phosphate ABC transporter substrate-binding protein PstS n=1 Tax=Ornithinimicrobium murale TaxID=1050153 RepID=UPI001EDEE525|nr:phosphate ABC transporter substrate-binding protein PstS [Ornithinimicrobium murale]